MEEQVVLEGEGRCQMAEVEEGPEDLREGAV